MIMKSNPTDLEEASVTDQIWWLGQVSSVAILAQTNWTVSAVPSMSSNPQPLANSERTGQIVGLLIIHHWLTEPDPELASASKTIAGAWAPTSRALHAAALRVYLEVEREYADQARSVPEDTSLFEDLVSEFPENFGYD